MIERLFQTHKDFSSLVLRVFLGMVIFPHGAQKLLGWFGGYGFSGTMGAFTTKMGIPIILAFLVIMTEFFGSLGLIIGFLTRIAALGVSCIMVVAIFMVHVQHGFFMNWSGKQRGEGFEFHLLALAIAVALMMKGGGRWSIDGTISKKAE